MDQPPISPLAKKERGTLQIYALLSFVNCGIGLLIYGMGLLFSWATQGVPQAEYMALFTDALERFEDEPTRENVRVWLTFFHAHGVVFMGILLLRTVVRLVGVIQMWKGRLRGFHTYAFAQLVGIFAPHVVLPWEYLGVLGPLCAIGMTALYGIQVKRLENAEVLH